MTPLITLVEIKVNVRKFAGKLKKDIERLRKLLDSLSPPAAHAALAVCVFQVHHGSGESGKTEMWKRHALETEKKIRDGVEVYAAIHPDFEFEFRPLQKPDEGVYDDIEDRVDNEDGAHAYTTTGTAGSVVRDFAILFRRKFPPGPPPSWWPQSRVPGERSASAPEENVDAGSSAVSYRKALERRAVSSLVQQRCVHIAHIDIACFPNR